MDCSDIREYIYSFLDGQLDIQTNELVKEHLLACPVCSLELEQEKKLGSLIKNSIPKENAPYELKETVLSRIRKSRDKPNQIFIFPLPRPVVTVALSLLFIGVLIIPVLVSINKPFPVFSESIKDHIQFLQGNGNPAMDIVSNKPEEIHHWLQTKLDFRVMVPELSSQGLRLLGARRCSFKDKKVAYIMYGRNGHKLSVFMFDAEGVKFPKAKKIAVNNKIFYLSKEKGYNSALWIDEGIACVFVSDLDEAELLYLASL